MPWPRFDWQRFANAYSNPAGISSAKTFPTAASVLAQPDLTILEMKIDTRSAGVTCLTQPEPLGIRILIANIGDAASGVFQVEVNGQRKGLSGLEIGQSLWLWFEGYRELETNAAMVDTEDQVRESDESNNQSSQMLVIPTAMPTCTQ